MAISWSSLFCCMRLVHSCAPVWRRLAVHLWTATRSGHAETMCWLGPLQLLPPGSVKATIQPSCLLGRGALCFLRGLGRATRAPEARGQGPACRGVCGTLPIHFSISLLWHCARICCLPHLDLFSSCDPCGMVPELRCSTPASLEVDQGRYY